MNTARKENQKEKFEKEYNSNLQLIPWAVDGELKLSDYEWPMSKVNSKSNFHHFDKINNEQNRRTIRSPQ